MNNINKELITIILSVKGRQDFSKRWLEYMALIDCKYPIALKDSFYELMIQQITGIFLFL